MKDSTLCLHGHVVRNISYVHLKGHTRNKISAEMFFPFIRKVFHRFSYIGKKSTLFPREILPTDITRIQPCLSARRYVLSALIIGSLSPWL